MSDIGIDSSELKELAAQIQQQLGLDTLQSAIIATLRDTTRYAHKEAIRNAPRSATRTQNVAARKITYIAKHGNANGFSKRVKAGLKRRKASSHCREAPGGLERSIQYTFSHTTNGYNCEGEIFVASNAEAGKYAAIIHDGKGKRWRKRGIGTIAKGKRADDKFISRAITSALSKLQSDIANAMKGNS